MKGREQSYVIEGQLGPLVAWRPYQARKPRAISEAQAILPSDVEPLHPVEQFTRRFVDTRPGLVQTIPKVRTDIQPVAHVLDYNYDVEDVDLTVEHEDHPLHLRDRGIKPDSFTLTRVDAAITFKVNSQSNRSINASKGLFLGGMLIEELYVSNAVAVPGSLAEFVLLYDRRADTGINPAPFGQY